MTPEEKAPRLTALNCQPVIIQCSFLVSTVVRDPYYKKYREPSKLEKLSRRLVYYGKGILIVGIFVFVLIAILAAMLYFNIDPMYVVLGFAIGTLMAIRPR